MKKGIWLAAMAAAAWMVPVAAGAQQAGNPNDPWCKGEGGGDRGRYCEVREMTAAGVGALLTVNAGPNGGIKIVGSDRRDVFVRAKVSSQADTDDEAQGIAKQVVVHTGAEIRTEGPARDHDRSWSVSFEISVPFDQGLSLSTMNGGISISSVRGQAQFSTQNGGISLSDVAGNFKGRTQNGGITVILSGQRWEGEGLDVQTQNGGIHVRLPEGFSAHLETSTVNGGVSTSFPVSVTGQVDRRHLIADLNGGGPTLKLTTTNGGVSIQKK